MTTHTARTVLSRSALVAAVVLGGCADKTLPPIGANDHFRPDDEARSVDTIFAVQTANAAREDGTLYPQHFTDGQLNSLGYEKLSAIAYGPDKGKLAIYLDVPKGDTFTAAQDSVMKALARGGVAEDAYTITAGPNPNVGGMADTGLKALAKQSSGDAAAGDASASAAMGAAAK